MTMHKRVPIAALLLIAAGPAGSDAEPGGYAVRLRLAVAAAAPVQRVELPASALVALRSAGMTDLRVFDGRGRPVPTAWSRPAASAGRIFLPARPILGTPDALTVTGMSLRLDGGGSARVAQVNGTVANRGGTAVLGAMLDARAVTGIPRRLLLDADLPAGQPVTVTVAASEDLAHWQPLGERVIFRPSGTRDGDEAIALDGVMPRRARLRVTWRAASRLVSPVTVRGAVLVTQAQAARAVAVPAMLPPMRDPRTVDFAFPFVAPVRSIAVRPSAAEAIVPIRLLGRDTAEDRWTLLGQGVARAEAAGMVLSGAPMRMMRIEADPRVPGFAAPPLLVIGFEPAAIAFAAVGPAPFTLAAGRPGATDAFLPLATILGDARGPVPSASVAAVRPVRLVLAPADDAGAGRRTLLLWALLLGATALLGGMAWQLRTRSAPCTESS